MCTYLHFVTDCRSMIHDNTAMRITTQKALFHFHEEESFQN